MDILCRHLSTCSCSFSCVIVSFSNWNLQSVSGEQLFSSQPPRLFGDFYRITLSNNSIGCNLFPAGSMIWWQDIANWESFSSFIWKLHWDHLHIILEVPTVLFTHHHPIVPTSICLYQHFLPQPHLLLSPPYSLIFLSSDSCYPTSPFLYT